MIEHKHKEKINDNNCIAPTYLFNFEGKSSLALPILYVKFKVHITSNKELQELKFATIPYSFVYKILVIIGVVSITIPFTKIDEITYQIPDLKAIFEVVVLFIVYSA